MQYLVRMMQSTRLLQSSPVKSLLLPVKIEPARSPDIGDEVERRNVEAASNILPNTVSRPISIQKITADHHLSLDEPIFVETTDGFLDARTRCSDSNSCCLPYDWFKNIALSSDCHECNIQLELVDETFLQLRATKFILEGESLKLWFSQELLIAMKVPFLSPLNIQDEKLYICNLCDYKCDMPNPLKIHLALSCNAEKLNILWTRLKAICEPRCALASPKLSPFYTHRDVKDESNFRSGLGLSPIRSPDKPCVSSWPSKTSDKPCISLTLIQTVEKPCLSLSPTRTVDEPCVSLSPIRTPDKPCMSVSPIRTPDKPCMSVSPIRTPDKPCMSLSPIRTPDKPRDKIVNGENGHNLSLKVSTKRHSAFKPYANHSVSSWFSTPRPEERPAVKLCASELLISQSFGLATSCAVSPGCNSFLASGLAYHGAPKHGALYKDPLEKGGVQLIQQQAAEIETFISNLGKSKQGHLCIYCGKTYSRKYGLKIHIRTHTGFKPLKCKYCLRPFGDPSNLNKHIRLHAGGKTPYKCDLCGKILVRRRDLEKHIKSRHYTC